MDKDLSVSFDVVEKTRAKKGAKLRAAEALEVDAEVQGVPTSAGGIGAILARAQAGGQITMVDLFGLLQHERAEQRADMQARIERERAEAERAQQRDREFMQMQMGMFAQLLGGRAAGPAVDYAAELSLMRRELALAQREGNAELRLEIRRRMADLEAAAAGGDDEPEDPDEEPPETLEEAGTMLLQKLWRELSADGQVMPKIAEAIKRLNLSPAEAEKLAQVAAANGAARA